MVMRVLSVAPQPFESPYPSPSAGQGEVCHVPSAVEQVHISPVPVTISEVWRRVFFLKKLVRLYLACIYKQRHCGHI